MTTHKGNILYIDQNEQYLSLFRQRFKEYYNIFLAQSSNTGMSVLREYDVDVILVNQRMSDMTGIQFCENINPAHPDIRCIIVNDSDDIAALYKAFDSGKIYRFIRSSCEPVDLKMIIDGALQHLELEKENRTLTEEISKSKSEQEHVMNLFKRYVPEQVVSQSLLAGNLVQYGESRIVSVLFSDIRNFMKISSRHRPDEVFSFLNDYWGLMTKCVTSHKGSVNNYMGDGMLAVFGAPVSHVNNHHNAVYCALEMIEKLEDINEKYLDQFNSKIEIGVGINTGEVMVGNVGSDTFLEYTVIGDTVNQASRLENLTKDKPNAILISENTYSIVKDEIVTGKRENGTIAGKDGDFSYYQVKGRKSSNVTRLNPGLRFS